MAANQPRTARRQREQLSRRALGRSGDAVDSGQPLRVSE